MPSRAYSARLFTFKTKLCKALQSFAIVLIVKGCKGKKCYKKQRDVILYKALYFFFFAKPYISLYLLGFLSFTTL